MPTPVDERCPRLLVQAGSLRSVAATAIIQRVTRDALKPTATASAPAAPRRSRSGRVHRGGDPARNDAAPERALAEVTRARSRRTGSAGLRSSVEAARSIRLTTMPRPTSTPRASSPARHPIRRVRASARARTSMAGRIAVLFAPILALLGVAVVLAAAGAFSASARTGLLVAAGVAVVVAGVVSAAMLLRRDRQWRATSRANAARRSTRERARRIGDGSDHHRRRRAADRHVQRGCRGRLPARAAGGDRPVARNAHPAAAARSPSRALRPLRRDRHHVAADGRARGAHRAARRWHRIPDRGVDLAARAGRAEAASP